MVSTQTTAHASPDLIASVRDRYVVVSADTHAGAPPAILRDYYEAVYLDAFDDAVRRHEVERAAFQEVLQRWAEAGGVEAGDDPTAALAEIALPIAHWREVEPQSGRLMRFLRPRDLDPALGPVES